MTQTAAKPRLSRRSFLIAATQLAGAVLIGSLPTPCPAAATAGQRLSFYHTHTGERLQIDFHPSSCSPRTIQRINRFLRDHRTGEIRPIDLRLLEMLCHIKKGGRSSGTIEVISGYRSPKTNAMLQQKSSGVASKSLHLQGQAIDIRLPDLKTSRVRDIARSLQSGGVGYYPTSDFVHLDTGRVRFW
ncbi:YcbK family protein [Desulfofustis glycolicus]|uniref:Murein endopeptidase K n=1 Tax=Desulfofustis glycolicus DSM 9705 TaxID=1121409 RepID=A0A1M5V6Y0_9BACT|nr:DUF882 domain-containing protein [Desulfofustis glycolicus]MCB2214950.1 DUF882 domain-containing protein [Desulfobulbaceae bacterium]SHH70898.1 Uncharacterized conserved protein YcbK, DUF882 family [Desulfofustis glycolicus DSM 9705]